MRIVDFQTLKLAWVLLGLGTCLAATGCRSDNRCSREIALMRAEIIDVEDKYARLRSKYESTAEELSGYTGKPVDMTPIEDNGIFEEGYYLGDPVITEGEIYYEGAAPGEIIYESSPTYQNAPPLNAPADQSGNAIGSGVDQPPVQNRSPLPGAKPDSGGAGDLPLPGEGGDNGAYELPLTSPTRTSKAVGARMAGFRKSKRPLTEVLIQRGATRPVNIDGTTGDDGVRLLIQPRTVGGQVSLDPGEMTVSIVDPQRPAGEQRIGLWKFLPEETELFFVNDELGSRGILLHLPWEHSTPRRSRLIVHVRYVGPAGNIFRTSSDLRIDPPPVDYSAQHPAIVAWARQDWRESTTVAGSDPSHDGAPATDNWNERIESARNSNAAKPIDSNKPRWRPVR